MRDRVEARVWVADLGEQLALCRVLGIHLEVRAEGRVPREDHVRDEHHLLGLRSGLGVGLGLRLRLRSGSRLAVKVRLEVGVGARARLGLGLSALAAARRVGLLTHLPGWATYALTWLGYLLTHLVGLLTYALTWLGGFSSPLA